MRKVSGSGADLATADERARLLLFVRELWKAGLDVADYLTPGDFTRSVEEFQAGERSLDPALLFRLEALLLEHRLSSEQLGWLSRQAFLEDLGCAPLVAGAKAAQPYDAPAARRLAVACAGTVRDTASLCALQAVLERADHPPDSHHTEVQIAVGGNCTLGPLVDRLSVGLLPHGIRADVWELSFDQWAREMLDPQSSLARRQPSFLVLYLSSLGLSHAATRAQLDDLDQLEQCVRSFAERAATRIVLVLPEPLEEGLDPSTALFAWREELVWELRRRLGSAVTFVDPTRSINELGERRWYSAKHWYLGKFPCHPNGLLALGRHVALTIARSVSLPVKVIACDLDNTLWGGVVGEDGWEGVRLDVHSDGGAFLRLQAYLKRLMERGILLVVVSKNNEADAREVFDKRPEMLLGWDDFAVVDASWSPKSESLERIARTLNLGLGHFCLLDDSPFERAQVRSALPEVLVPELPSQADEYVSFLARSGLFHLPVATAEDRERTILYRAQASRSEARESAATLGSFLRDLELRAIAAPIGRANQERVVQLIHKTNQFNLTTRRHEAGTVAGWAADEDVFAWCYRVQDRFGDSGIVGVLIALPAPDDPTSYLVDTWILSCRVMGRTVENAMFQHLLGWLSGRGVGRLQAEYVPSQKNKPVEGLLQGLGFTRVDDGDLGAFRYEYHVSLDYDGNEYVRVSEQEPDGRDQ